MNADVISKQARFHTNSRKAISLSSKQQQEPTTLHPFNELLQDCPSSRTSANIFISTPTTHRLHILMCVRPSSRTRSSSRNSSQRNDTNSYRQTRVRLPSISTITSSHRTTAAIQRSAPNSCNTTPTSSHHLHKLLHSASSSRSINST